MRGHAYPSAKVDHSPTHCAHPRHARSAIAEPVRAQIQFQSRGYCGTSEWHGHASEEIRPTNLRPASFGFCVWLTQLLRVARGDARCILTHRRPSWVVIHTTIIFAHFPSHVGTRVARPVADEQAVVSVRASVLARVRRDVCQHSRCVRAAAAGNRATTVYNLIPGLAVLNSTTGIAHLGPAAKLSSNGRWITHETRRLRLIRDFGPLESLARRALRRNFIRFAHFDSAL